MFELRFLRKNAVFFLNLFKEFLKKNPEKILFAGRKTTQNRFLVHFNKITIRPEDGCHKHKKKQDKAIMFCPASFMCFMKTL